MDTQRDTIMKNISGLLDDIIAEYTSIVEKEDKLSKADGDVKMQPDENGDMANVAGQASEDAIKPLKKEDEKIDEKKDMAPVVEDKKEDEKKDDEKKDEKKDDEKKDEKEVEKADEKKEDEKKDDKKDDDEKEDDEDEKELQKFMGLMEKAFLRLGLFKSEEDTKEEPLTKSDEKKDEGKEELKSLNERMVKFEETIGKISATVEKIAAQPVNSRQSLDGYSVMKKSAEDDVTPEAPKMAKEEALGKLIELQRTGDKRVTTQLITKFELSGNMDLVKGII